uniref:Uncharacterized protein n=1 Tax=Anguilla anguilla TaxID=7936 RepID=A0A0E9SJ77_ANGAN
MTCWRSPVLIPTYAWLSERMVKGKPCCCISELNLSLVFYYYYLFFIFIYL